VPRSNPRVLCFIGIGRKDRLLVNLHAALRVGRS
jgi:hypothetical protein